MPEPVHVSRRCFLCVVASGVVASELSGCSAGPGEPQSFGAVSAGNIAALQVGDIRALSGAAGYIARDTQGVYAMTSTCPHAGCDMIADGFVDQRGVYCGCHGSRFDTNGKPIAGPAHSPLTHFAVDIDAAGEVTVHGDESVPASTRAPVA